MPLPFAVRSGLRNPLGDPVDDPNDPESSTPQAPVLEMPAARVSASARVPAVPAAGGFDPNRVNYGQFTNPALQEMYAPQIQQQEHDDRVARSVQVAQLAAQDQQQREAERQQEQLAAAQEKASKDRVNSVRLQQFQAENRPHYIDPLSGLVTPNHSDEQWQNEKATRAENDALRQQYFTLGRPYTLDRTTGAVIPKHTDEEWQALQDKRQLADQIKGVDAETADLGSGERRLMKEADRTKAQKDFLQAGRDAANMVLLPALAKQSQNKQGGFLGMGASPTPEATDAQKKITDLNARLEKSDTEKTPVKLNDDEVAQLAQLNPDAAKRYTTLGSQLSSDADNQAWHQTQKQKRADLVLRLRNPQAWQQKHLHDIAATTDPDEAASLAKAHTDDFHAQLSTFQQDHQAIQQQEAALKKGHDDLVQANAQAATAGIPVDQAVTLTRGGQTETWRKDLADQLMQWRQGADAAGTRILPARQALDARARNLSMQQDLAAAAQLHAQSLAVKSDQQQQDLLRANPSFAPILQQRDALTAEIKQRAVDIKAQYGDPADPHSDPTAAAAMDSLQQEAQTRSTALQQQMAAKQQQGAALYDKLRTVVNTDGVPQDEGFDQYKAAVKESGLSDDEANHWLAHFARADFTHGNKDDPSRILSDGTLAINPSLWLDKTRAAKAIADSGANPAAKKDALARMPEMENRAASAMMPALMRGGLGGWNSAGPLVNFAKEHHALVLLPGYFSDDLGYDDARRKEELDSSQYKTPAELLHAFMDASGKGAGWWATQARQVAYGLGQAAFSTLGAVAGAYGGITHDAQASKDAGQLHQEAAGLQQLSDALPVGQWTHFGSKLAFDLAALATPGGVSASLIKHGLRGGRTAAEIAELAKTASTVGKSATTATFAGQSFGDTLAQAQEAYRRKLQSDVDAGSMTPEEADTHALDQAYTPAIASGLTATAIFGSLGHVGLGKLFALPSERMVPVLEKGLAQMAKTYGKNIAAESLKLTAQSVADGIVAMKTYAPEMTPQQLLDGAIHSAVMGGAFGAFGANRYRAGVKDFYERLGQASTLQQLSAASAQIRDYGEKQAARGTDPDNIRATQDTAYALAHVALGKIDKLTDDQLALLDVKRGADGKLENVETKDAKSGAVRDPRVKIEGGNPIITQPTLDRLAQEMPAVRQLIKMDESQARSHFSEPDPSTASTSSTQSTAPSGTAPSQPSQPSQTSQQSQPSQPAPAAAAPDKARPLSTEESERVKLLKTFLTERGVDAGHAGIFAESHVRERGITHPDYRIQAARDLVPMIRKLGGSINGGPGSNERAVKALQGPAPVEPAKPAATPSTPAKPATWVMDNARTMAAHVPAEKVDHVERLSADKKTAREIAAATGLDEDTVRAVRLVKGIPSWTNSTTHAGGDVEAPEFTQWREDYLKRQQAAKPAAKPGPEPTPTQPPPAKAPSSNPIDSATWSDKRREAMAGVRVEKEDGSPDLMATAARRKQSAKALEVLDRQLARFGKLFPGGVRIADENRSADAPLIGSGGGMWVDPKDKALVVHLPTFLNSYGRGADPRAIQGVVEEELVHRVTLDIFHAHELADLWTRLPAEIRNHVWNGYHAIPIRDGDLPAELPADLPYAEQVNMAHELIRMLVQDKAFRGRVTESLDVDPSLKKKVIDFLKSLVAGLRKLIAKADPGIRSELEAYEVKTTKALNELLAAHGVDKKVDKAPEPTTAPVALSPEELAAARPAPPPSGNTETPLRKAPESLVTGKAGTAYTDQNDPIEFHYGAAELDDLTLSNHDTGAVNPGYPPDLQPRDRSSAGSQAQVSSIAQHLNFERLAHSNLVSDGAPIIGPDGVVESGNGRLMGARRSYDRRLDSGAAYKAALLQRAAEFGLDPEKIKAMKNPVLVRVRTTPMDTEQRKAFTQAANVSTVAPMREAETAKKDAGNLTPAILSLFHPGEDGNLLAASNHDFIRAFARDVIPPTERAAAIDRDGNLSQSGLRRVRNALFAAAYGHDAAGQDALARLTELTDDGSKNLITVLTGAAPIFAEQKARMAAGTLHGSLDLTADMAAALGKLNDLRHSNTSVSDYLNQDEMPGLGDNLPPVQRSLLQSLDQAAKSPKKLREALERYQAAVNAAGNPQQASLFGETAQDKDALWNLAVNYDAKALASARKRGQADLDEKIAAKLYKHLFELQQSGQVLSRSQQEQFHRAELALGQQFMFDDLRSHAPAEDLTLESQTEKEPQANGSGTTTPQQLALFSAQKRPEEPDRSPPIPFAFVPGHATVPDAEVTQAFRRGLARESGSPAESSADRSEAHRALSDRVRRVAQETGRLIDSDSLWHRISSDEVDEPGGGEEHDVFVDRDGQHVIKLTAPGGFGVKGLQSWLANIDRSNAIFDMGAQFVGATDLNGHLQLVLTQPYIRGPEASEPEIARAFGRKGFFRVSDFTYYNPDTGEAITDAQPRNVLRHIPGWNLMDAEQRALAVRERADPKDIHPIDVHFVHPSATVRDVYDNVINSGMYPRPLESARKRSATSDEDHFVEPGFYSHLQRALAQKMPATAGLDQIKGIIAGGGIKTEELKWSGILPWLESQSTTPEAARQWLTENGVPDPEEAYGYKNPGDYTTLAIAKGMPQGNARISKDAVLDYLRNEGAVKFTEHSSDNKREQSYRDLVDALKRDDLGGYDSLAQAVAGIRDHLAGHEHNEWSDASRDAARRFFDAERNGFKSKYSQYQLPGGTNYREVVLAVPLPKRYDLRKEVFDRYEGPLHRLHQIITDPETDPTARDDALVQRHQLEEKRDREAATAGGEASDDVFHSSHFGDVPNYVAHMRLNDRTDTEGQPGTLIEEIQSDRHQKGRKQGYEDDAISARRAQIDAEIKRLKYHGASDEELARYFTPGAIVPSYGGRDVVVAFHPTTATRGWRVDVREVNSQGEPIGQVRSHMTDPSSRMVEALEAERRDLPTIPDAPFRQAWPLQMFKRALREAVETGKSWIGWTTGDTQAQRYDLSKQVDSIDYAKMPDGRYAVYGVKDGRQLNIGDRLDAAKLDEYVGKEVAQKIVNGDGDDSSPSGYKRLAGHNLKVGGEGMKGAYDKILPIEVSKYVKQWGGKVEKAEIQTGDQKAGWQQWRNANYPGQPVTEEMAAEFDRTQKHVIESAPIHRVEITPAMQEGVKAGQPLFSARKRSAPSEEDHPSLFDWKPVEQPKPETSTPAPEPKADSPISSMGQQEEAPATTAPESRQFLDAPPTEPPPATPASELLHIEAEAAKPKPKPGTVSDFGEKIGGARKDMARPQRPRGSIEPVPGQEEDTRPAWRRKYIAAEEIARDYMDRVMKRPGKATGRWTIIRTDNAHISAPTFASEAEADAAIPLIAVSQRHGVSWKRLPDGGQTWGIYRRMGERKRPFVKTGFDSAEDAQAYMAAHPEEILEHKFPIPERPWLDRLNRDGGRDRTGDVTPQMFQEAFGFRGGEFGNWNMGGDGQAALNHAYDALHDFADMLGVQPRALSLNGDLAIAFGARGTGGTGAAAAHYEPGLRVINLTKIRGAGSLAHEWFHALDHYLATQDGRASDRLDAALNTGREADKVRQSYVSHGFSYNSKVRQELRQAFKEAMDAMTAAQVERAVDPAQAEKAKQRVWEHLRYSLQQARESFASTYNKRQPTAAELAEHDRLSALLAEGQPGERTRQAPKGNARYSLGWESFQVLDDLDALHKKVTGRSLSRSDPTSTGRQMVWQIKNALDADARIRAAGAGATEKRTSATNYLLESRKIDETRADDYWSTPHEMGARAFESFVADKLANSERRNDYLVSGTDNRFYVLFDMKPYPEGEERSRINGAFQKLLDTVEQKETDKGIALQAAAKRSEESRPPESTASTPSTPDLDQRAHEAATSPHNDLPQPTQPQKEAGNYQKGHVRLNGMDVSIENPAGSTRSGTDASGKPWSVQMQSHYGYIRGTEGRDGEHIDTFIKPGTPQDYNGPVYIVNQNDPSTGRFDEHKAVIGASSKEQARLLYQENYAPGWKGAGSIVTMPMETFKRWISRTRKAPASPTSQTRPTSPTLSDSSPRPGLPSEASAKEGRAQPLDDLIQTPAGLMQIGDVEPGFEVTAPDGSPQLVRAVHPQGKKGVYRLNVGGDSPISARFSLDHLFVVKLDDPASAPMNMRLHDIIAARQRGRQVFLPVR